MSGSGGGSGYEYQAMATAYVAAHILSQVRLGWIEHETMDIPISVAEETGGAGDDLCITLSSGIKIELQAKHGLQKDKLWEPLIKLGKGLISVPQMYGVILTDSTASKNIREDLRNDFKRLGQGRTDDLKVITKEAQIKLVEAGLPESDQDFFRRLVIIVLDLDTGLQDGKHVQLLLSHVLIDKKQSEIVWDCLCKEGQNLISHRGIRDLNAWRRLISDRGIQIATDRAARNLEETCKELEDLCKEIFTNYRQLTTNRNSLMAAIGLAADLSSVIPLEIVERKQTSKSRDDIQSPEQGSSFYQPTETEKGERFATTNEFLAKVIRDRNTSKSKGLRLAVTGEAGAGKTTLLQTIGSYIDTNGLIPIWIPLQSLNKNIDAYLAEDYLRQITATLTTIDISIEYGEALNELLKSGRVVLLLDGADEATDRNILQNLDRELQQNQLFKNTQVILSCRINAWDEGWRGTFDVYRIVPFTYPDQVENYIDRFSWGEEESLANNLKTALRDEKRLRLRDMVANPLRLALLCYIWKDGEESLPDTRAELYRLMLKAFYKQKQDELANREFDKPSKELEKALGELALNAMDRDDYRFLIPERDIQKILGELDAENGLFLQATKRFGLLNHVGKSSKRSTENVYAFWHPTFQEYFAALAIDKWRDFLPTSLNELKGRDYRIFDVQWHEVILLWLGRENINNNYKETFIKALIEFKDECEIFNHAEETDRGFYGFRAYCLAALCLPEFRDYKYTNEIVEQIVKWAFGYFDFDKQKWIVMFDSIETIARKILPQTRYDLAVKFLCEILEDFNVDEDRRRQVLEVLGASNTDSPSNVIAARSIIALLEDSQDGSTRRECVKNLGKIAIDRTSKSLVLPKLLDILDGARDEYIYKEVVESLVKITTDSQSRNLVISKFINILEKFDDELTQIEVAASLGEIATDIKIKILAINKLIHIIRSSNDEFIGRHVFNRLGTIATDNESKNIVIPAFIHFVEESKDIITSQMAAENLAIITIDSKTRLRVVDSLIKIIDKFDKFFRPFLAKSLANIAIDNESKILVIPTLIRLIKECDEDSCRDLAKNLETLATDNISRNLIVKELIFLLQECTKESIQIQAAESLAKISTDTETRSMAIKRLIYLLDTSRDRVTRTEVVLALKSIPNDSKCRILAIQKLLNLIQESTDRYYAMHYFAMDSLGEIATDKQSQTIAVPVLISFIQKSNDNLMRCKAAIALGAIASDKESRNLATQELIRLLWEPNNEFYCSYVLKILGEFDLDYESKSLAILSLTHLAQKSEDVFIQIKALECLVSIANKYNEGKILAVAVLINLMEESKDKDKDKLGRAVWGLEKILEGASLNLWQVTVIWSRDEIRSESCQIVTDKFKTCYRLLCYCAQNMPYPTFCVAWRSSKNYSEFLDNTDLDNTKTSSSHLKP